MEIKYEVLDRKVKNFTVSAKRRLKAQIEEYTEEIIAESQRIAKLMCEKDASVEITESTVYQAIRKSKTEKKRNTIDNIISIISDISLVVVGVLFDTDKFITPEKTFDSGYFSIVLIAIIIAIGTTVVKYFR